jgi:hypothetical protein
VECSADYFLERKDEEERAITSTTFMQVVMVSNILSLLRCWTKVLDVFLDQLCNYNLQASILQIVR